jgi:hypothetical protein
MRECVDFYPVPMHGRRGLETHMPAAPADYVLKASLDDDNRTTMHLGPARHRNRVALRLGETLRVQDLMLPISKLEDLRSDASSRIGAGADACLPILCQPALQENGGRSNV